MLTNHLPIGKRALVLLSGGQDSTTCLYWAKQHFEEVNAIGFYYGQRHAIELEQAQQIAALLDVSYAVMNLAGVMSGSALIGNENDVSAQHALAPKLPAAFVPGRNAIFLAIAASHAYNNRTQHLVSGMCQADYSGYPDCRRTFVDATEQSLALALAAPIHIHTPLMDLSKAQVWQLSKELGCLEIVRELSHTDYNGNRTQWNEWGYGCLDNPASVLRAKGYEEAKANGWI